MSVNKENKPLRIVRCEERRSGNHAYINALSHLAVAESNLVQKRDITDSAYNHFVAIVKELEDVLGFKFETVDLPPIQS